MRLRINFNEPLSTGAPDYIICGQGITALNLLNLSVTVKMGGVDVFTTADFSTFNPGALAFPIVLNDGIEISNIVKENVNWLRFDITMPEDYSETTLDITASKVGYLTYTNILKVFNYDLGTNSNVATTANNPKVDFVLINETNNLVAGIQTMPFSYATSYWKPFTREVFCYDLTSSQGTPTYHNGSEVVATGRATRFIAVGTEAYIDIKQTSTLVNASTCTEGTASRAYNMRGRVGLILTGGAIDCIDDNGASIFNTYSATAELDYTVVNSGNLHLQRDDVDAPLFATQELKYELIDYNGNVVETTSYTITVTAPSYTHDEATTPFSFAPTENGAFIIKATLINYAADGGTVILSIYTTLQQDVCHFFDIKKTDCGIYKVSNLSFTAITLVVSMMNDEGEFEEVEGLEEIEIEPFDNYSVSLDTAGIYQLKTTVDSEDYIRIVANHCNLIECMREYLKSLMCVEGKKCCDDCAESSAFDWENFTALSVQAHIYFMLLNNEFNYTYLYNALTSTKLSELFTLSQYIARFDKYCESCESGCEGCS